MVHPYFVYLNEKTNGRVNRKRQPHTELQGQLVSSAFSRNENLSNLAAGSRSPLGEEAGFV